MKTILKALLALILILFSIGFYKLSIKQQYGNYLIGIGVLLFAFLLLPLFLYHRYKGKQLEDYTLNKEKIDKIFNNIKDSL